MNDNDRTEQTPFPKNTLKEEISTLRQSVKAVNRHIRTNQKYEKRLCRYTRCHVKYFKNVSVPGGKRGLWGKEKLLFKIFLNTPFQIRSFHFNFFEKL